MVARGKEADYVFVYGTLRPKARRLRREAERAMRLLEERGEYVGPARIKGKLYRVSWYPGVRESSSDSDVVVGDVFRAPDYVIAKLDAYEDASTDPRADTDYLRRRKRVRLADGRRLLAWTYVYKRAVDPKSRIPGGDFVREAQRKSAA